MCLLSAVMFAACVAAVPGIWIVRARAIDQTDRLGDRVEAGLQRTANALDGVRKSVQTAKSDLQLVEDDRDNLEAGEKRNKLVVAYLKELALRLGNFAEAAAAEADVLRLYGEATGGTSRRISPERAAQASSRAAELSATVQKLRARLGEDKQFSETEVVDMVAAASQALSTWDAMVVDCKRDLEAGRADLADARSGAPERLKIAAYALSFACGWLGIGQIVLLRRRWRVLRAR